MLGLTSTVSVVSDFESTSAAAIVKKKKKSYNKGKMSLLDKMWQYRKLHKNISCNW